jgi:YggT family protein
MTGFIFFVLDGILSFFILALVISAILSWLVLFNVINPYNPTARKFLSILDSITNPILEPFRRFIPPLGGLDLSFLVAILVIQGMQSYLLPIARNAMFQLVGS